MDATRKARDRLSALSNTLGTSARELSQEVIESIQRAVSTDPGLPRPDPTISLWQQPPNQDVAAIQSTQMPEKVDFVVIGSGITGCSVTKALLEHPNFSNQTVALLEARTLVSGATGRNGGNLVTAAGHTYKDLIRRYGEDNAKAIVRFSILNINHIKQMVREMDSELQEYCQLRDVTKVMVATDRQIYKDAKASMMAFKAAMPEHKNYHSTVEEQVLPERWNVKDGAGAIEHESGAIWPYRLLTGILARLLQRYPERLSIEANTPVTKVDHDSQDKAYPYTIQTPRGTIRASRVIYCTNGFTAHLLPTLLGKLYPFREHMSVQKPGSKLPNAGNSTSWSFMTHASLDPETGVHNTGLCYLQQNAKTADIWVGTEASKISDTLSADDTSVSYETLQVLTNALPRFFHKGWAPGETAKLRGIWTGIQGHTSDGLPLVGKLPPVITGRPGTNEEYIAAGFNGYGMDKCWLTGEALVRMIAGEDVSSWFPQLYMIDEKRFKERMDTKRIVEKFSSISKTGTW